MKFLRRKLFVSQYRKISYRNLSMLYFRKFPVAKKFMDKREEKYQDFRRKFYFLTGPKRFCRGTLLCCVSENFRQPKSLWIRGRGSIKISFENFLSHSAEKRRRGTL